MKPSPENAHVPALVDWLSRAENYPHPAGQVTRIETHISWVFLAGEFAYKLKKPVQFPFLDFTTLQARHHVCQEEVRLNRRLADEVYLGVVAVGRDTDDRFVWDGGAPIEWLVKMRRLDADRALDRVLGAQTASRSDIEQVCHVLAEFYAAQSPLTFAKGVYTQRLEELVRQNLEELLAPEHGLDSLQVHAVHGAQLRHLSVHVDQFEQRVGQGRIVEGHGDLRPEHIYLTAPPVVIDCLEFRQDLRQLDALDELSFLAMECRQLGAPWVGQMVLDSYKQATGDPAPEVMIAFYSSYRACVRAKVTALRAQQQSEPSQRKLNQHGAQLYLESAAQYAHGLGKPWLVVVRGLTGTGKSTLARQLAHAWDAALLQTDVVRQERFGPSTRPVDYDQGAYQAHHREEVYREMFRRADPLVAGGRTVLLDGTFLTQRLRDDARKLAEKLGARSVIIEAVCPPEVALERIKRREGSHYQSSADVYHRQRKAEEPEPPHARPIRVDTTQSPESMIREVCRQLA